METWSYALSNLGVRDARLQREIVGSWRKT